jgi:Fe-S cluster biogenesis protein NfuA
MRRILPTLRGIGAARQASEVYLGFGSSLAFEAGRDSLLQLQQKRTILVEASLTPNPDCLRFFSMELSFLPPGTSMDLPNEGHGYKSPLAESLFRLDGIKSLYFADEYISVTKDTPADWASMEPLVKEVIIAFAESGKNILSPEQEHLLIKDDSDTEPSPSDDDVVLAIKELLATRIRPMIRADGGNVRYVGMDDGTVYVLLEGACKTCPSSGNTLKNGIERMLMHWIPEVVEVVEVDEDFAFDFKRRMEEEAKKKEESSTVAGSSATPEPPSASPASRVQSA